MRTWTRCGQTNTMSRQQNQLGNLTRFLCFQDLENNEFMRHKYGADFDEPVRYIQRLKEAKIIALKDAEYNLVTLVR